MGKANAPAFTLIFRLVPVRWSVDTFGIFMCLIGVSFLQRQECGRLWLRVLIYGDLYVRHSFSAVPAHNSGISLGTLESITLSVSPLATFVCRAIKWGWQMARVINFCSTGAGILWRGWLFGFNFVSHEVVSSPKTDSLLLSIVHLFAHLSVSWRED